MAIPEEILMSRKAVVTEDTTPELIDEIKDYNVNMGNCIAKMKSVDRIKKMFVLMNVIICFASFLKVVATTTGFSMNFAFVLLFGASILVFSICGRNLLVTAAMSLLLIPVGTANVLLTIADIFIGYVYTKQLREISDQPDFPKFREILIVYGHMSRSRAAKAVTEGDAQIEDLCDSRDAKVREDEVRSDDGEFVGMPEL